MGRWGTDFEPVRLPVAAGASLSDRLAGGR